MKEVWGTVGCDKVQAHGYGNEKRFLYEEVVVPTAVYRGETLRVRAAE